MFSSKVIKFGAAGVAAVAIAVGGVAIGNSSSSSSPSATATAAQPAGHGPRSNQGPRSGQPRGDGDVLTPVSGKVPSIYTPGTGTIITGATADKATAAAATTPYQGQANRVLKLSDGSYVVHLIATSGPHHVFISSDFKVTGAA